MIKSIDTYIEKHSKQIIIAILAIQLLIYVLLFLKFGYVESNDDSSYYLPAIDFIQNGTMCDNTGPTLIRTPGYILFVSLIYSLTNYSNEAVVIVQIIISISITYLIYYLVSKISKKKTLGCFASLFYICDLAVYSNALSIVTDTLFPFLIVLSLLFLYKYLNSDKYLHIFLCFLFLNYALAVRPQIVYLNLMLNVVLLVLVLIKKIKFKLFITFLVMFLTIYGGWSYRNYVQFSKFDYVPLRSRDYFLYYAPTVYEQVEGVSFDEAQDHFYEVLYEEYPDIDSYDSIKQIDYMSTVGKDYVKDHLGAFIICNFKGLFLEMVGPGADFIENMELPSILSTLIKYGAAGMLLLSYLIYASCFLSSITRQKWFDWMILLVVMYLMASTAIVGYSRYRLAFYPLCLIGTFTSFKRKMKQKN